MSDENVKKTNQGTGSEFLDGQRAVDEAKNEQMRSERKENKLDPEQVNRPANRNESTETVSKKKVGGGKSKALGD